MSDTITTPTSESPGPLTIEGETAEKRERRSFPIRLFAQEANGAWLHAKDVESFTTIEQAERWIERTGATGIAYMMARVIGAKRRPPTRLEDVAI